MTAQAATEWTPVDDGRLLFRRWYLDEVARVLGVTRGIDIDWTDDLEPGTDGLYTSHGAGRHKLQITCGLSAERAARTIWHELGHGVQIETHGSLRRLRELVGDDAVEAEAISFERRYGYLPVVRPAPPTGRGELCPGSQHDPHGRQTVCTGFQVAEQASAQGCEPTPSPKVKSLGRSRVDHGRLDFPPRSLKARQ